MVNFTVCLTERHIRYIEEIAVLKSIKKSDALRMIIEEHIQTKRIKEIESFKRKEKDGNLDESHK